MADDLADAQAGTLAERPGAPPSALPATAVPASVPRKTGAVAQVVKLPPPPRPAPPRRRGRAVVAAVVLLVLVGAGGLVVAVQFLRLSGSGTFADVVPAEALAFVSARADSPVSALLLSTAANAVGPLALEQVAGATDVAFVLLPGASASEPVSALLIRGRTEVDLAGAPELSARAFGPDAVLITRSDVRGRLQSLSGSVWGHDRVFQRLLRGLPTNPPVLAAIRQEMLTATLQPYLAVPALPSGDAVIAALPDGDGTSASVVVRVAASGYVQNGSPEGGQSSMELAAKLPDTAVFVWHVSLAALDAVLAPDAPRVPPELRTMFQALRTETAAFKAVRDTLAGPVAVAVLPTSAAGVRDTVILLPLREDADPRPALRTLEPALVNLGAFLGGSVSAGTEFVETTYRDVALRYINFGSPARALDSAVVDGLLVLATSRESMQATIDVLRRASPQVLSAAAHFAPLTVALTGQSWIFLAPSDALLAEVPVAARPLHALVRGLILRPSEEGTLVGALLFAVAPLPMEPSSSPFSAPAALPTGPTGSPSLRPIPVP